MNESRHMRLLEINLILDKYKRICGSIPGDRIDRLIDLDVSNVDTTILLGSKDGDFVHDCNGIFENLVRDVNNPNKSYLNCFVPRCGLEKDNR